MRGHVAVMLRLPPSAWHVVPHDRTRVHGTGTVFRRGCDNRRTHLCTGGQITAGVLAREFPRPCVSRGVPGCRDRAAAMPLEGPLGRKCVSALARDPTRNW